MGLGWLIVLNKWMDELLWTRPKVFVNVIIIDISSLSNDFCSELGSLVLWIMPRYVYESTQFICEKFSNLLPILTIFTID